MFRRCRKTSWPGSGTGNWDSCSSNSICCRARRRLKMWNCRPCMRESRPKSAAKRAMESLTRVGLADRAGHHPSQLSGGQQQRVAIARGLVNRPSILLADEPTGNLDSRTSVEIMDILQTLNNEQGLTIVLVTHEPDIAQYSKRTLEFRDGKLAPGQHRSRPLRGPRSSLDASHAGGAGCRRCGRQRPPGKAGGGQSGLCIAPTLKALTAL